VIELDCKKSLKLNIPFQYLTFFLDDDDELERIRTEFESGKMETSEIKKILIKILQNLLKEIQERRKNITDDDVKKFMDFSKNWWERKKEKN
jgi:tryptophanyl-tRNA synthetase